jgi:hypothetical protein
MLATPDVDSHPLDCRGARVLSGDVVLKMSDFDVTESVLQGVMQALNNSQEGSSHSAPPDDDGDDAARGDGAVVVRVERDDRSTAWGIRMNKGKGSGGFAIASVDPTGPAGEDGAAALTPGSSVQAINGHDLSVLPKAQLKGILSEAYVLDFTIVRPVAENDDNGDGDNRRGKAHLPSTGDTSEEGRARLDRGHERTTHVEVAPPEVAPPSPEPLHAQIQQPVSVVQDKVPPRRKLVRSSSGRARARTDVATADHAEARGSAPLSPGSPDATERLAEAAAVRDTSPPSPPPPDLSLLRAAPSNNRDREAEQEGGNLVHPVVMRRNSGPKEFTIRLSRDTFEERWGITLHADTTTTPSVCRIVTVGPTGNLRCSAAVAPRAGDASRAIGPPHLPPPSPDSDTNTHRLHFPLINC